jgi:hypothetical protein
MKTLEIDQMSSAFRKAARLAHGDVLVLTRKGKPQFAVVGVDDEFALEALALSRNTKFMTVLDEIAEGTRHKSTATLEEVEAQFKARSSQRKRRPARKSNGA